MKYGYFRASLRRAVQIVTLFSLAVGTGCSSTCQNGGITVDGHGNVLVFNENGYASPNSSILRHSPEWLLSRDVAQRLSPQSVALTRDGAMFVLRATAQKPNLIYRVDLSTGQRTPIGSKALPQFDVEANRVLTSISATDRYVYAVDATRPVIRRASLSRPDLKLTDFISGPATNLRYPNRIAVDGRGRICVLDGPPSRLMCYAADRGGNIVPSRTVDIAKLVGFVFCWDMVFDPAGNVLISGTTDPSGYTNFAIASIDVSRIDPKVVRMIAGPHTGLNAPTLAVDKHGNILSVQSAAEDWEPKTLSIFGPGQHGDVAPQFTRKPAADLIGPSKLAIDPQTGDVAVLGSDGVAVLRPTVNRNPRKWPERYLPYRAWDIAFGAHSSLVLADELGGLDRRSAVKPDGFENTRQGSVTLHAPEFVATAPNGSTYVASSAGIITRLPSQGDVSDSLDAWSFRPKFADRMSAFAADGDGYFYFAAPPHNAILTITPQGRESQLAGSQTRLDAPSGVAVSSKGELYVANANTQSILVFARGSNGNSAPIATIEGSATQLRNPRGVAIGADGRLYVLDAATSRYERPFVRVFAADARGNAAPITSYEAHLKCS